MAAHLLGRGPTCLLPPHGASQARAASHGPPAPTPPAQPAPPCCVQAGYNFLYGLFKYQWDADCELFLRILLVWARV